MKNKKQYPKHHTPKNVRAGRLIRQKRTESRRKEAERNRKYRSAEGVFCGTRHGYGFAESPAVQGGVLIPAARVGNALDGDRIEFRYFPSPGGRWEGEITKILSEEDYRAVGVLGSERIRGVRGGRQYYVSPSSPRLPECIAVDETAGAKEGDKVLLVLPRKTGGDPYVEKVFGAANDPHANYEAILANSGIETEFTSEELREAEQMAAIPLTSDGRTLVTDAFTMDGADAKDLDDAVSVSATEEGWLLGVHIADVSEYVRPRTALDRAAMARGTSVYFADKVVPMLPPALSNGACSLNASTDKYALSTYITVDKAGNILHCRLEKTRLRSRVRGVYNEINEVLEKKEASEFYEKYRPVLPSLLEMQKLYEALALAAKERGGINFEAEEAEIFLDESGAPVEIIPRTRGESEKMIEQFMLAANVAVATLLHEGEIPCVYRVHEAPPSDKLPPFFAYAHNLGLDVGAVSAKKLLRAADFAALLAEAEKKGLANALHLPMLRTMAKAKYSEEATGHFGLSYPLYCHFTSPIRRLSDLATHRIIKAVLLGEEEGARYKSYARRAAIAATEAELRALTAERKIEALYKTLYLSRHIGEAFDATVTSITSFGVFATLPNTCEGLIPLEEFPFGVRLNEEAMSLTGKNGFSLRIADPIRIRVAEADVSEQRVKFSLA